MAKNTICLWYDKDAEAAARFYAETFPDSEVGAIRRAPSDYPSGKAGDVLVVEFTVAGIPCIGLNGGPAFRHNEAFSFQIATDDQDETDRYWNAIVGNGGQESACGWCRDKWGVSWQVTPRAHRGDGRWRRGSEASIRCDDEHEEDRHRRDRGGATRLMQSLSHHCRMEQGAAEARSAGRDSRQKKNAARKKAAAENRGGFLLIDHRDEGCRPWQTWRRPTLPSLET